MQLEELKNALENNGVVVFPLIFVCKDKFIPLQYISRIDNTVFTSDSNFVKPSTDIFSTRGDTHYVYECDELNFIPDDNAIIICKKLEKSLSVILDTTTVPQIDVWMIQDYVYSVCEGVPREKLSWLISLCKNDIYRIQQEVDRICIFDVEDRARIVDEFIDDNIYNDLSDKNIFTISNAIQSRNRKEILGVLKELETAPFVVDVEPLGLLTILYNNFVKMIKVWLNKQPTEANTGLNKKQIWAINNLPKVYSKEELINIFKLIARIDSGFKSGVFPIEILVDYLIIKTQVKA